jgi:hypothetical protein
MRQRPKDTVAKEEDTGAKEEGRLPAKKKKEDADNSLGRCSLLHEGLLGAEF